MVDLTGIGLFDLASQRLAWAEQRQGVLAQNVANANTPGFRAKDLPPFAVALAAQPTLITTSPSHMTGGDGAGAVRARIVPQGRSPNGNAVSLEDQLVQVADTASSQELTLNLYRRYQGMIRLALGRGA